jgi:hypothetical protein
MARRKAAPRQKSRKPARKAPAPRRSAKRRTARRSVKRPKAAAKKATRKIASKRATSAKKPVKAVARKAARKPAAQPPGKVPRLDRARRTLTETETHSSPPSSLDMGSLSSAARSGRAGMEHSRLEHLGMNDVTTGDPDVDVEDAYFTGEEAPGGDNPTPDQDIVEDIGKALGVTYNDNEELEGADKLEKRDKHRWELDPASSDDYRDRD